MATGFINLIWTIGEIVKLTDWKQRQGLALGPGTCVPRFQRNIQVESIGNLEKCAKRSVISTIFQSRYGRLLCSNDLGELCLANL